MTAVIKHLEDTLPKVPADPPRERTTRRPTGQTPQQREVEDICVSAGKRMTRIAERQPQAVSGFAAASLYRLVGSRVDMAKYAKSPEAELMALQQTLSLLTWELGNTLDDIRLSTPTEKKAAK